MSARGITVILGSGASYASGYTVRIPGSQEQERIPPPMDKGFFKALPDDSIKRGYPALYRFRQLLFADSAPDSLEEVWTSVDLNHKHIRLGTYPWLRETQGYKEIVSQNPSSVNMDIHHRRAAVFDSTPQYNKFKFLGDCGRDLRRLIYNIYHDHALASEEDRFRTLHEILKARNPDFISYVTFNYDCCLEASLQRADVSFT